MEQEIFDLKDVGSGDAPFAAFAIFMLGNSICPQNKVQSCTISTSQHLSHKFSLFIITLLDTITCSNLHPSNFKNENLCLVLIKRLTLADRLLLFLVKELQGSIVGSGNEAKDDMMEMRLMGGEAMCLMI